MVERAAGQQPAKPVMPTQAKQEPARVKPGEMSHELATISRDTSNFVLAGKGKSLLGAGKLPEYSNHPTGDSKRVSQTATGLIVQNKKARHS